jgi:hypothetical protein
MSQSLILIDGLSSSCWDKKRKRKRKGEMARGAFIPRAGHPLLVVP